ncbi:MAG: tyrosine-type recombinase/integrase [Candidatus Electronema sp. V4]|uniref:tyrosine-type recombinase/integrase n=1 Tax=Candidatus Electronema sp. V4 TaxID=3454756 RepID=UPI0040558128
MTKKQDIYYFRQACPRSVKEKIGRREIVRSLGVREKSAAVRIAREFKVSVDNLTDYLLVQDEYRIRPADYLDEQLRIIRRKYEAGGKTACSLTVSLNDSLKSVCETVQNSQAEARLLAEPKTDFEPLVEKFKAEKMRLKRWTGKTLKEKEGHFALLMSVLKHIQRKNILYIEYIDKKTVRELKEIMLLLPKNYTKMFPSLSFGQLLDLCKKVESGDTGGISSNSLSKINEKISLNTLRDKYCSTVKDFWIWLNNQSYIDSNVFSVLNFDVPRTCTSWETLSKKDLEAIFNHEIFSENQYAYNYQRWVPAVALFTACRLQEICQLRVKDVDLSGKNPCIKIEDENDTSLKTASRRRTVPIHPELMMSGFAAFVEEMKRKGERYLFPELKETDGTTNSKRVSKWFNERLRKSCCIGKGKSFHSFRRTFINEMSRNGASDSETRSIVGHKPDKNDTLNNHYKDELSTEEKAVLIKRCIKFEGHRFPWS